MDEARDRLQRLIREIPDFPKPGIRYKDICPLIRDPHGLRTAVHWMAEPYQDQHVRVVAAPDARGFIFGSAVAIQLGCGFVPIRKLGKLPGQTTSLTYDLEYGQDTVEVQSDAIQAGERVLLVDDVLATGGTMAACARLVEMLGGTIIGCQFLLELTFLEGRARLKDYRLHSLLED
ncbi:MAG: adenine phosphoribosyltransferase [Planctomycetota bacterium]